MKHRITIQKVVSKDRFPSAVMIRRLASRVFDHPLIQRKAQEINIRMTDIEEISMLNETYRHKSGPTNILSFPADILPLEESPYTFLGDLVICADIVNEEAKNQGKTKEAHWTHMIIHGILHLLGYDHEHEAEAVVMESLEINILHSLGFPNPYENE